MTYSKVGECVALSSRITKYNCSSTTPILLSVLDPDSTVFAPRGRKNMSPSRTAKKQCAGTVFLYAVRPLGLEPRTTEV